MNIQFADERFGALAGAEAHAPITHTELGVVGLYRRNPARPGGRNGRGGSGKFFSTSMSYALQMRCLRSRRNEVQDFPQNLTFLPSDRSDCLPRD